MKYIFNRVNKRKMEAREIVLFIWNKRLSRVIQRDCCRAQSSWNCRRTLHIPLSVSVIDKVSFFFLPYHWTERFVFALVFMTSSISENFSVEKALDHLPLKGQPLSFHISLFEWLQFLEFCITGQVLTEEFLKVKS